jgi:hypothetical protein
MESENTKAPRMKHADRVTLSPELLGKIDAEIEQVTNAKRGVHLSRTDYVVYRLKKTPKKLSPEEIEELITLFYDDERFLKEALKEVRAAKARGEVASNNFGGFITARPKPRKRQTVPKSSEISDSLPVSGTSTESPAPSTAQVS